MGFEIRDHPDAPSMEELRELTLVPIPPEEIERRVEAGERLREVNLMDERDDVVVHLNKRPMERERTGEDIGTALYRLVQLFGTPQFPGFAAGTDVSDRDNETFKYLFELQTGPEAEALPDSWLVTVFDYNVRLGVGLAGWEGEADPTAYDAQTGLVSVALVTNVVTEPVQCEFENKWF